MQKRRTFIYLIFSIFALAALAFLIVNAINSREYRQTSYAMNTIISQTAYGKNAEKAMAEVNTALADIENTLSLYVSGSEISQINENAGISAVKVSEGTLALIKKAVSMSKDNKDAFAITLAPIALAWGINSDAPRVLSQDETDKLLPLVDDESIIIDESTSTVFLPQKGQGIDLGGIAKGASCAVAKEIYASNGVKSALLSIGGNVYACGTKPNGKAFQVGFRDPANEAMSSIASFSLTDKTIAVSGGYERYFEADGKRYIHIFSPETGYPVESDVVSVGVISDDGAVADFYSTTLYVKGTKAAIEYLSTQGEGIMLDGDNNLYVSKSLSPSFTLLEDGYNVIFV
ncbi:MAG: FAD:protein FMN transferase [Clostridia bacterium]|nr:FAD:protein FMN transferase [Clostridia bacterium]NLS86021.1 FAD:protein FMN transferase [Oscillospiraceae bacterium]